ncbi:MAG: BMC domain-containing protein [Elusimicrobia bacterium]|nr:BMC domain-containing protein [Elusimicrobiota bacterium]
MNANIAIAMIETSSIAKGYEASDAMCKMASVTLVKTTVVARGKLTILISGPVGEVESALRAGIETAKDTVVHQFIIRNVHQQVLDTLEKRKPAETLDAVGIIETKEAIAAIQAADAAAKAASIRLLETKAVVGGGKGMVTLTGEIGAVRSAVAAAIAAVPKGMLVTQVVIPQPDKQLFAAVGK